MATLKLDIDSKASVKDTVKFQQEVPVETPKFLQRSVCYWDIKPGETTEIVAQSDLGDKFAGTIAEFNRLLGA